jgi:hypothetical protein
VKACLVHYLPTILAIPTQSIYAVFGSRLLQNDAHSVRKTNGVVRSVGREKEEFTFSDGYVLEWLALRSVDHAEQHGSLVLVEELGCGVDVIIGSSIGATYDLWRELA